MKTSEINSAGVLAAWGDVEITEVGCTGRGDNMATLYERADGAEVFVTNGDPVFGGEDGFADLREQMAIEAAAECVCGFASGAGLPVGDAADQWAGWSNQLTDAERAAVMAGGFAAGVAEGHKFRLAYPEDEDPSQVR